MAKTREVLICSKEVSLRGRPGVIGPEDRCYYLCDDYAAFAEIKKRNPAPVKIRLLGKEFHRTVDDLSRPFMDLSHRINRANPSYAFWGTHLASRNSGAIPLLKYVVYFHCARKIMETAEASRLVFICDSRALARLIGEEARNRGMRCRIEKAFPERTKPAEQCLRLAGKAVYFLLSGTFQWIYSRTLTNKRITGTTGSRKVILRSWVTAGSIDKAGRYRDRNFGVLPAYLEERGKEVWTIPLCFNLDRSVPAQMKLMAESGYPFLLPEQYLTITDIARALRDGVAGLFPNLEGCEFEGRDISCLIREIHLSVSLHPPLLSYNSIRYLLERLRKSNVDIERFIYPIENNPPEKPFILAARRSYPAARISAFQHTVWLKEQLGMFFLPEERATHPLPDEVICSGPRYPSILEAAGFPRGMALPGPNLRYTAVNQSVGSNNPNGDGGPRKLLVILNYDTNQNMELLEKAGLALKDAEDVRIFIKAHPTTDVQKMGGYLQDIGFPAYEWAPGTVQEWLARVHVVMMTGGSVSNLETMATGVPLIRVSLENNFDFDCLWDEYPFSPFVSSPAEIRERIDEALRMGPDERRRLMAFGKEMVGNYFEPVTPATMAAFL